MRTKQDFVNYGMQYFAQKEYDRAIFFFRKALDCDEEFENAYRALCESLNRINEIDEAFLFARKWIEINEHNPLAHMMLSKLYVQKGMKADAKKEMELYRHFLAEQKALVHSAKQEPTLSEQTT